MINNFSYVYLLASKKNGTLYIVVTSDLKKRIWQHKNKLIEGFTKQYNVNKLVYYTLTENIAAAIKREKELKKWKREWKIKMIEKENPEWRDLYDEIQG